ncbi:toxin-antitoxin system YwqK family antitoxin [Aquimarina sp. W85]|uniref:toxin-antitoxin system YwqK family antitoxin n=1 Tax=Aquimarina rhodophyticola TaxID=3342246 RepID=UPI0036735BFD
MKNYIIAIVVLLFTTSTYAQDIKPKFDKQGDLIKGTFFYENGEISQEGFYKEGKLHGKWVSYNRQGEKTAIGNYNEGVKSGKWFFWNLNGLSEVDYSDNQIASVIAWGNEKNIVSRD